MTTIKATRTHNLRYKRPVLMSMGWVGTTDRWNNAKTAELQDRVVHENEPIGGE